MTTDPAGPAPAEPPAGPARTLTTLDAPRDGVPPVVADPSELAEAIAALARGTGPVAVDAERASGHRYGQRAFLVQLRRAGTGTLLIDPAALPDLSGVGAAIADAEWVLHAAGQDLPCLAEVGMRPNRLFDTELGCRLAGMPRVGLAAVVEEFLGLGLAKEHSAVDWSTRPLPEPWLRYAALDVEVLIDLRDAVAERLAEQGKLDWAIQEFAAIAAAPPAPPRQDPWRRTSGLHRLRTRRQLGMLRELWIAREDLARVEDVSPGRIVPDASLVAAVLAGARNAADLSALKAFTGRGARRHLALWSDALAAALALPDAQLPPQHLPSDGPPPPRAWPEKDPAAAARLTRCRATVNELSEQHTIPVENLLSPDALRRLAWAPPTDVSQDDVRAALSATGARDWQLDLTVAPLTLALVEPEPERQTEPQGGLDTGFDTGSGTGLGTGSADEVKVAVAAQSSLDGGTP